MALEPTHDQLRVLAGALVDAGGDVDHAVSDAMLLWPLVRDMVLEAAKHECEAVMERFNASAAELRVRSAGANGAANCAAAIRAMKGNP